MRRLVVFTAIFALITQCSFSMPIDGNNPWLINNQNMHQFSLSDFRKNKLNIKTNKSVPQTVLINTFVFENNQKYTSDQLRAIISDKIGDKPTKDNLNFIKIRLMNFYQNNGYIAVKVNVSESDKKDGSIMINIFEGEKDSIKIESFDDID